MNELSSSSSIYVSWDAPISSNIDIDGYNLYIDDGLGGEFKKIYDGSQNPQVFNFNVENLVGGRTYNFYMKSSNINGESSISSAI